MRKIWKSGIGAALLLAAGASLAGCAGWPLVGPSTSPQTAPTASPQAIAPAFTQEAWLADVARRKHATPGLNALGFEVFEGLAAQDPGKNVAVSPSSLGRTLLMAYLGARGTTRDTLASALGMPDQTEQTLGDWVAASGPNMDSRGVAIRVLDSAWIQTGFPVLPSFLEDLQQRFQAKTGTFSDEPDGTAKLRDWIAQASQGLLDGHDYQMDGSTLLALADVLTFDGRWDSVFDAGATQPRPFHVTSTESLDVPMMHQTGEYGYAESEGYQVIRLPYEQSVYAMYVLQASDSATASLDAPRFERLTGKVASQRGEILLPRFTCQRSQDLTAIMKTTALGPLFTSDADFSGIAPSLMLSKAWQQVRVAVDETGTVAAAATVLEMNGKAAFGQTPFRMEVNRPFYFALRDDSTQALLFLGKVVRPQ